MARLRWAARISRWAARMAAGVKALTAVAGAEALTAVADPTAARAAIMIEVPVILWVETAAN